MYTIAWNQKMIQDHKKFSDMWLLFSFIFLSSVDYFFNKIPSYFNFYCSLKRLPINLFICKEMGLLTGKYIFNISLETQSHHHFFCDYNPLGKKVST